MPKPSALAPAKTAVDFMKGLHDEYAADDEVEDEDEARDDPAETARRAAAVTARRAIDDTHELATRT